MAPWFQERMEFGPRALGNRSILSNPSHRRVADTINAQINYRERRRPVGPSMLDRVAPEVLQTGHPSPYMTFTFDVAESFKGRIPDVVHEDGTARAQIVGRATNPRVLSLDRGIGTSYRKCCRIEYVAQTPGESMVCSPTDASNLFFGSDLRHQIMEDLLVRKP